MPLSHGSGDPLADRRADFAAGLATDGDAPGAADLLRQALELAPAWVAGWVTLGGYREAAGMRAEAALAYRTALALDPADGHGASLKLAALGEAPVPATAPAAFVRGLFDQYAAGFEAQLVGRLGYRVPDLLLAALTGVCGRERRFRHALDLGCGTGLMGERLRPVASRLSGLDLSPAMLEKARRKGIYDALQEGDLLALDGEGCDLVAAADVLNYVGDLSPVFGRVAACLEAGGLFVFSVEAHGGEEPFVLAETLRYRHAATSVEALLQTAGFAIRAARRAVLRQDRGEAVEGMAFVAERQAGGNALAGVAACLTSLP